MDPANTYRSALFSAHKILCSLDVLSARLSVDQKTVMNWMAGHGVPPLPVFLQVVDIIVEHIEAKLAPELAEAEKPVVPVPSQPANETPWAPSGKPTRA